MEARDLTAELAQALDMLFQVATDPRSRLPRTELYTDMALTGAYTALKRAKAAGLLIDEVEPSSLAKPEDRAGGTP